MTRGSAKCPWKTLFGVLSALAFGVLVSCAPSGDRAGAAQKTESAGVPAREMEAAGMPAQTGSSGTGTADPHDPESPDRQAVLEAREDHPRADRIVLKLASTLSPDVAAVRALIDMADEVFVRTEGKIDIQIYPNSALGDQVDYVEGVSLGTVELCLVAPAALESVDPHFAVFGISGVFTGPDKMDAFFQTTLCRDMLDAFERKNGIRILGHYHDGFRNVWLRNREIRRLEDFQGLRLRVPEVSLREREFSDLGAETVRLPLSDCLVALQSGFIDGLENNVETIVSSGLSEQLRFELKTEHAYSTLLLLADEDAWLALDRQQRTILEACIRESEKQAFAAFSASQEKAYREAGRRGIETLELSETERDRIRRSLYLSTSKILEEHFPKEVLAQLYDL